MLRIRILEEVIAERYSEWKMRCPVHLCIGQEAIAAGVCHSVVKADAVYSNHRAHGHYLAKGGDMRALVAELYGKQSGCASGRGGSMHLIDRASGFIGSTPIVGGTVPLAVGHAWASALRGEDSIAVVFFGDGCFEEGVMHESMNFAVLHKLPVIFICENNSYAVYTHLKARQPERAIHEVARAHGLNVWCGEGNSAWDVYTLASAAETSARMGEGPQFLEFSTHRWLEHCGPNDDDELGYREAGELSHWTGKDPLKEAGKWLLDEGVLTQGELTRLVRQVESEVADAFRFAEQSPGSNIGRSLPEVLRDHG